MLKPAATQGPSRSTSDSTLGSGAGADGQAVCCGGGAWGGGAGGGAAGAAGTGSAGAGGGGSAARCRRLGFCASAFPARKTPPTTTAAHAILIRPPGG